MKSSCRRWFWLLVVAGGLWFAGATVAATRDDSAVTTPTTACRQRRFSPVVRHAPDQTSNWAGYVSATDLTSPLKRSVTGVRGTWTVPAVSSSAGQDTASAIWVGIDGSYNRTVEQIGTEQDVTGGVASYYAWFEMYPGRAYWIQDFPVAPGDVITAEVLYLAKNRFQLSITNVTQNTGFSIVRRRAAKRTSAEWIVEAPFFRHILPLADFGATTFTNCSATITGQTGPINDPAWQNQALQMTTSTGAIQADTSAVTTNGDGFTVTWSSN